MSDALSVGYRSIDTAQAYMNEEGVGRAWQGSGVVVNFEEAQARMALQEVIKKYKV